MNSEGTSKKTPQFTIIKNNWLMMFKEVIAVYSDKHNKFINTKYSVTYFKEGETYIYHWSLEG
jgi:hypothetical protein